MPARIQVRFSVKIQLAYASALENIVKPFILRNHRRWTPAGWFTELEAGPTAQSPASEHGGMEIMMRLTCCTAPVRSSYWSLASNPGIAAVGRGMDVFFDSAALDGRMCRSGDPAPTQRFRITVNLVSCACNQNKCTSWIFECS
jgi:hypothetical protein